ncbi:hypothetical protein QJQ45_022233, partial [Haematococcus lacustris]
WMPGDDSQGDSVNVTGADVRAAQAELDRVFGVTRRASTPSQALDQCENEALAMVKCMDQHRGPTWYWSCGRYYVTLQDASANCSCLLDGERWVIKPPAGHSKSGPTKGMMWDHCFAVEQPQGMDQVPTLWLQLAPQPDLP